MAELTALQEELQRLPMQERLRLAHWLLDSLVDASSTTAGAVEKDGPLADWVGLFSGGPGDTAEQAEEILAREIEKRGGFGNS